MTLSLLFAALGATVAATEEYAFQNTRALVVELPLASRLDSQSWTLPRGVALDRSRPGRLVLLDHRTVVPRSLEHGDAPWANREFSVQLPVTFQSQSFYHGVYTLVDDDVAMLLARDALGKPGKLGDFLLSSNFTESFEGGIVSAKVSRRGVSVFSVKGTTSQSACPSLEEVGAEVFDNLLGLTTEAPLPAMPFFPNPLNSVFLHLRSSASAARDCFEVDDATLHLAESSNLHEPISMFFGTDEPTPSRAILFTVDLGASSDAPPALAGAMPYGVSDFLYFKNTYFHKYGGAPVNRSHMVDPDLSCEFEWQNGHFIWFEVALAEQASAASLLPPNTTLATDQPAAIFSAWYPTALLSKEAGVAAAASDNFPYHEMGVRLPIRQDGDSTVYWHVSTSRSQQQQQQQ